MADIELVIKIPEEEYRWIIKSDKTVFADVASKECMLHSIKNGMPLPKGHGDLIDRSVLKNKIVAWLPPDPCGCEEKEYPFETDIIVSTLMEIDESEVIIPAEKEEVNE